MTNDYYGWTAPNYHQYTGVTDDYAAERAAQSTPYEPTRWDDVNIEQMWEYVRKESDERTTALAETWRRAASLLQSTRENLKRHADSLDARWSSPAARVFMSRVGATLHSLDEWKEVASNNATGLEQIAGKIKASQRDMRELWLQYKAEQQRQQEIYEKDKAEITFSDIFGDNHKTYEEVQREFHQRAKDIAKPLADLYIDVYISNISRGGKFKGPTDAVMKSPDIPAPGRPGTVGNRPVKPGVDGNRPNRPSRPDRPDTPTRPDLGDRPTEPTT
ncbi:WXG100 family type VII secretion target, partial [Micromonospora craterilacus]|uniref:WXG100 family type VII secretion target n=1 Tax=Micromonospora craterilacus TaxID=1655439 RepID=UPI0034DDAC45